jgi:hypothetical protein
VNLVMTIRGTIIKLSWLLLWMALPSYPADDLVIWRPGVRS